MTAKILEFPSPIALELERSYRYWLAKMERAGDEMKCYEPCSLFTRFGPTECSACFLTPVADPEGVD